MFEHEALHKLALTFETSIADALGWVPAGDGHGYIHVKTGSRVEVTSNGTLKISSEQWMTKPHEIDLRASDPFTDCRDNLVRGLPQGTSDLLKKVLPQDVLAW